jgi:hypothetical protein
MWFFKRKLSQGVEEAQRQHEATDLTRRQHLIEEIKRQLESCGAADAPVVSVESFFSGNEDSGSIGCNLSSALGPHIFHERLRAIQARPDVQDVLVEIRESNEDDPDPFAWPFSDQIYLLTSAAREDVKAWLAPLQPDEVEPVDLSTRVPPLELGDDVVIFRAWWD